ncbi:MAG: pirin family protein [Cyclobacteriaceae bacterium]|nr:pirin family protein [Cyclobacteriaceae bacterium]MCH8516041.1 pirin family protein [Cyclobacteriaceae bacterium]
MKESISLISAHEHYIADLKTNTPLPNASFSDLDPFLLLNHHGPQKYTSNNNGLPFGPHPHRGMETVTFILKGDIMHKDSTGHESIIDAGGIQYMRAGSGLIHAEVSSDAFKKSGGELEIMQLWLNLPASHKMSEPYYKGFQRNEIPVVEGEGYRVDVISGNYEGVKGAFQTPTDVALRLIRAENGSQINYEVKASENIFFYIVSGEVSLNDVKVNQYQLAKISSETTQLIIKMNSNARILLGHGTPFHEPIVAQGPFVMNSREEIQEAYHDYQTGKFGTWNH